MAIRYADSQEVIATCGPLIMRIIERAPTGIEHIHQLFELIDELGREQPKMAVMVVIHHHAPIPAPHALRYMASAYPRLNGTPMIFAMLGLGFWALTAKCALMRLAEIAGVNVPVTTDLDTAAARLSRLTPNLDVGTIITTYESAARKMLIGAGVRSGTILA